MPFTTLHDSQQLNGCVWTQKLHQQLIHGPGGVLDTTEVVVSLQSTKWGHAVPAITTVWWSPCVERKIVCSRPVTAAENLPPQLWSLKVFDLKWIWDQVCFRILACHESRQKAFSARIVSCEACSEQLLRPKRKPWISVRICWDDTCTSILWTSRAQIWWVKREAFFAALWWTLHYLCTKHTAHICSYLLTIQLPPNWGQEYNISHQKLERYVYYNEIYILMKDTKP